MARRGGISASYVPLGSGLLARPAPGPLRCARGSPALRQSLQARISSEAFKTTALLGRFKRYYLTIPSFSAQVPATGEDTQVLLPPLVELMPGLAGAVPALDRRRVRVTTPAMSQSEPSTAELIASRARLEALGLPKDAEAISSKHKDRWLRTLQAKMTVDLLPHMAVSLACTSWLEDRPVSLWLAYIDEERELHAMEVPCGTQVLMPGQSAFLLDHQMFALRGALSLRERTLWIPADRTDLLDALRAAAASADPATREDADGEMDSAVVAVVGGSSSGSSSGSDTEE